LAIGHGTDKTQILEGFQEDNQSVADHVVVFDDQHPNGLSRRLPLFPPTRAREGRLEIGLFPSCFAALTGHLFPVLIALHIGHRGTDLQAQPEFN
jgi:hypothetical protein